MNDPRRLWSSIRRTRLVEVLAVYASASFVALQVVALFQDKLGLPGWLFGAVLAVLVLGLPIVVAATLAQGSRRRSSAEAAEGLEEPGAGAVRSRVRWRAAWLLGTGMAVAAALAFLPPARHAWQRMLSVGSAPPVVKLAVLPFDNLTGDSAQEFFTDGLTDEMTAQLGRLHPEGLAVIARTSAARFKHSDEPLPQIGSELGVQYVLEGSARREADTVRVTGELVRVSDQTTIWTDSYQREISGVLALQSDLARAISRSLALKLLPRERARLARSRTIDLGAFEAYLQGLARMRSFAAPDLDAAQRYFELALRKDPGYALAYSGLSYVWAVRQQLGIVSVSEGSREVRAAAERAVSLDSTLAEAHLQLANMRAWTDRDWSGAGREYRKAIQLNPNLAEARAFYGHFLLVRGHPREAMAQADRALELDPLNETAHLMDAVVLVGAGRYDSAAIQARIVLRTEPQSPVARNVLAKAYALAGDLPRAFAEERTHVAGGDSAVAATLDSAYADGGYPRAMRRAADLVAARSRARHVAALGVAQYYLLGDDRPDAFEWLERAFAEHDPNLPYIAALPLFDPLRSDPRFQALLRGMGLR